VWTTLVWTCCAGAAVTAGSNDWQPCRAASHRRYDEEVLRNNGGGGDHGYEDFAGGGGGDDDDDDGETDADDDYKDDGDGDGGGGDEGYFRSSVDDKMKRGAFKQYEKKADLYRSVAPASYASDAASGNGMRVDTSLLRGEAIELPTYVNVPVTLKCRFEPVEGTVDKFDTVVEAMYPGHRDAPPPPPSSHASRILKQLMGSVDGWRGVAHNSGRSVRRASGNRFGRREWPARDDEYGGGSGSPTVQLDDGYDQVAWNTLARQRAVDRMRRIQDPRQDFHWPEWFREQSNRLLQQRFGDLPVAVRKQSGNQMIEEQEAEQDVYDHGVDEPQVAQAYDQQVDGRQAEQDYDQQVDGRQVAKVYDQQVEPILHDFRRVESVDGSRQVESVDDSQQVESVEDSRQVESVDDSQQVERADDQLQLDRGQVEDRAAAEEVDDRRVPNVNLLVDGQQLRRDMTATTAPEAATTVISDFVKFRKGIPVMTYVEHAYTTDSAL